MRTLDRYILKSFLTNYLLSLFVLISLYIVLDLFVNFDEFTEAGKPAVRVMQDIANYYFFNLPLYFAQLSGVIILFAACGTLARLQRANEVTAILASGMSLYRVAAPIVIASLAMNGLLVANHEFLLPRVAAKLARNRDDVEGTRTYDLWCVKDGTSRLISAQRFLPKEGRIRGLYVMELQRPEGQRGRLGDVITADRAEWDASARGWKLINGKRFSVAQEAGGFTGVESLDRRPEAFYASTLSPEDLLLRKMTQWTQFLSIGQLNNLVSRGDARGEQIAQIKHTRFTMPINNMILLLLGISFFLNRLPGSVLTQGAKALVVCSISFMIAFAGQRLVGSVGPVPAALPAWLPVLVFGPIAAVLMDGVET